MFKRVVVILVLVGIFNVSPGVAEVEQFRFSNWPLADFEQREVLKPFGEEHFGADIKAEVGEEVFAAANGIVYWTYSGGANGIAVGIEHENGWRTTYLHLSERSVKKGQSVKAGDIIGKVGITGTGRDSEAPHLHFGLIKNPAADINNPFERYANPLDFGPLAINSANEEQPAEKLTEQPMSQYEQPSVSLLQQSSAQQPATEQIITTTVEPVFQPDAAIEQKLVPKSIIQSPAIAALSKKLTDSKSNKPSKIGKQAIKQQVVSKKPVIVRKSIALKQLTDGLEVMKKAARQSRGVAASHRREMRPTNIVGRAPRARLEAVPIPNFILLTPLALLLANLIRKSYNIVLT